MSEVTGTNTSIPIQPPSNSPIKEFWFHFKQNRGAVIGLAVIVFFVLVAIGAPLIAPYDPTSLNQDALRLPPIWAEAGQAAHLLGTDDVGRDLLSRLIYGARVSMLTGFFVVVLSLSIGVVLGLFSGYFGGAVDAIVMRAMDILMALPSIMLAIVVVSVMGPGINNAIIAVSIVAIPGITRVVRASVLNEKKRQYVAASRTFGASHWRIMVLEILPNCMAPLIVQATLGFSDGILNTAALGFLGLGAQPPLPEWGIMLSDSRAYIESSPWMVTLPGLCILFAVLGFNLLGDGLRDALDPKLKK
jgi:peptide/nickel transport system permease protein/dipeptide transport system permease protein